jgi:hypothetical protein
MNRKSHQLQGNVKEIGVKSYFWPIVYNPRVRESVEIKACSRFRHIVGKQRVGKSQHTLSAHYKVLRLGYNYTTNRRSHEDCDPPDQNTRLQSR